MSPEQKRGEEADERSDIYALGLMAFKLLTGRNPGTKPPSRIDGELARGWDDVVAGALEGRREARIASCGALLERLDAVSAELEAGPVRTTRWPGIEGGAEDAAGQVREAGRTEGPRESREDSAGETTERERPTRRTRRRRLRRLPPVWLAAGSALVLALALNRWFSTPEGWSKGGSDAAPGASRSTGAPQKPAKGRVPPHTEEADSARQGVTAGKAHSEQVKKPRGSKSEDPAITRELRCPQPGKAWISPSTGMEFVWIARLGLWMGKYEVTNAEYREFMPVHSSGEYEGHVLNGDRQPAANVSWEEAQKFCKWLTEFERLHGTLAPGQAYRLPRDWEWSVVVGLNESRAGSPKDKDGRIKDVYPWGGKWPPPPGAGNYSGGEGAWPTKIEGYRDEHVVSAPVGSFGANGSGLYDLGGNVWEWCEDWYDPVTQKYRVLRGGSWGYGAPQDLLSSCRSGSPPGIRYGSNGFRVVLSRGGAR